MAFETFKFHGASKFQVVIIGKYSTQKALLLDDRIQPILVWKYLDRVQWNFSQWNLAKRIEDGTSNFRLFAENDLPRYRKNGHKL